MAMTCLYMTAPAVAAAIGLYFFDRYRYGNKVYELGGGIQPSMENLVAKVKEEGFKSTQMPKLAPKFDGLHCFETLVGH
ncbi:unnamed protein product [Ilex paraguariensis]|uniref:Uncharacterized protein n=1 Tax=Ilex paraguariensis TaxID=185542 RepID=A0ABC8SM88_9AQUA